MKPSKRIISLFMVILLLITAAPYTLVNAAYRTELHYTLDIEGTCVDASPLGSSAATSFVNNAGFDGCYGNQLSDIAREFYDSLVKNYATDKTTEAYSYTLENPLTFGAEISGGSIVSNGELTATTLNIQFALQAAMDAFMYDHPEVFWLRRIGSAYSVSVSGSSATGYTGYIENITIKPTEIYNNASSKISLYDSAVDTAVDAITTSESRYDTLKSVHDYVCDNAWYNATNEQSIHSSEPFFIGDGGVVCDGYAKAFKVICDELELPCVLVRGNASGAHMWNYVQMDDNKWYLVDTTWDDQDSKIYDTYFLANANTIGFNNIPISAERTERTDFSGVGGFSFTYPTLSTSAYNVPSVYPKKFALSNDTYTYNGKTKNPTVTITDHKGNKLVEGTDYTVTFTTDRKSVGVHKVNVKLKGNYSGNKTLRFTILPKATDEIDIESKTKSLSIEWKKVTGADGYRVYVYKGSKQIIATNTSKLTYTATGLEPGTKYEVKVKAYFKADGEKVYAEKTTSVFTATKPSKVTLSSVTSGTKLAKLNWKATACTNYQIRYSTDKNFGKYETVTVNGADSVAKTIKSLKNGKTYYFKVRAYKSVDGVKYYGSFSSVKSVKVK